MEHALNTTSPLLRFKQEQGKKKEFKRYHSDRYMRLRTSWRHPRGLDNRVRKKHAGVSEMPSKRFRTPAIVKDILPCGFRQVIVHNVNDLKALTSVNRRYCATISKTVGARTRISIVNEAKLLGIFVTNAMGRLVEAIEE
jgi:large subunit ribosomal protein L32e